MAGFDILAAEQVLEIKKLHPQIKLITVAPYKEHFFTRESCWTPEWINRAREVFRQQDDGIKIAEQYHPGIYYERNRALVSHSTELNCFWNGGKGGTEYTVRYAKSKKLQVRLCKRCVHDCKQSFRAELLECPMYISKEAKKTPIKG